MIDDHALVDLLSAYFPATRKAYRRHGVHVRYDTSAAVDLDWTPILVALHARGYVLPGPTIGRVSYWLMTYRGQSQPAEMSRGIEQLVGVAWGSAAMRFIFRSAVDGPRVASRGKPFSSGLADSRCRYAFRYRDEPTPWLRRHNRLRRVVGTPPDLWRTVPWVVPTDLQERQVHPDQAPEVTHSHSSEHRLAAIRASLFSRDEAGLTADLSELKEMVQSLPEGSPLEGKVNVIARAAFAHRDYFIVDRLEALLAKAANDKVERSELEEGRKCIKDISLRRERDRLDARFESELERIDERSRSRGR